MNMLPRWDARTYQAVHVCHEWLGFSRTFIRKMCELGYSVTVVVDFCHALLHVCYLLTRWTSHKYERSSTSSRALVADIDDNLSFTPVKGLKMN